MKKITLLAVFFSLICFTAESGLPGIHKTGSKAKVIKETDEISSAGTTSPQTTSLAVLPDGKAYIGVNSYLSLRDEPFGKVGARLYNNDEVVIINRDGDWYEVETSEGTGWIYGKCVYDSPNSNKSGSDSETSRKTDEVDDYDGKTFYKDNGTYYYFTFDNPGDYNIAFTSLSEDNISEVNETSETNTTKPNTTYSAENTKEKPTKESTTSTSKNKEKTKSTTSEKKSKTKTKRDKAVELCYECAWGPKAKRKDCGYPNGKRKKKYVEVLQKVYGSRSGWGKQTRMGASCDVAAAAIIRYYFDKKFKRGCDDIPSYLDSKSGKKKYNFLKERNWKKWKPFTVIFSKYKSGAKHIFIYIGNGWVYNAHYCKKTYPRIEKVTKIYRSPKRCKRTIVFVPKEL